MLLVQTVAAIFPSHQMLCSLEQLHIQEQSNRLIFSQQPNAVMWKGAPVECLPDKKLLKSVKEG